MSQFSHLSAFMHIMCTTRVKQAFAMNLHDICGCKTAPKLFCHPIRQILKDIFVCVTNLIEWKCFEIRSRNIGNTK